MLIKPRALSTNKVNNDVSVNGNNGSLDFFQFNNNNSNNVSTNTNHHDFNHNHVYSDLNGLSHEPISSNSLNNSNTDHEIKTILINTNYHHNHASKANSHLRSVGANRADGDTHSENLKTIISRFGGEMNSPQQTGSQFSSGQHTQQNIHTRQSRPGRK